MKKKFLSKVISIVSSTAIMILTVVNTNSLVFADESESDISVIEEIDNTVESNEILETEDSATTEDIDTPKGYVEGPDRENLPMDVSFYGASTYSMNSASDSSYMSTLEDVVLNWPDTRNQGPNGTCWAHATIAGAEFSAIAQGNDNSSIDLSEYQLAYFASHTMDDPMGGLNGDVFNNTYDFMNEGGNFWEAATVLTSWKGAALESANNGKLAYPRSGKLNGLDMSDAYDYNSYILTDVREIPMYQDTDSVRTTPATIDAKQAIIDNGGLAISYYADNAYEFGDAKQNYYCPNKVESNHAVFVVGWDDNYSKTNFSSNNGVEPAGDGAWFVRNSWTAETGVSKYSYFYMSYYDMSLTQCGYEFIVSPASRFDNNYQYNGGDLTSRYEPIASEVKSANIYKVNGSEGASQEKLTAIQFTSSYFANVDYKIEVYTDVADLSNPTSGTLQSSATTYGSTTYGGIYTIDLEDEVRLRRGSYYSVVVTLESASEDLYYLPDMELGWKNTVHADAGESFLYMGSAWNDYGATYNRNWCMKAFTENDNNVSQSTYIITYDVNGGEELAQSEKTNTVEYGQTYAGTKGYMVTPVRKNYKFLGWFTSAVGGTQIKESDIVNITSDTTLYAHWEEEFKKVETYGICYIINSKSIDVGVAYESDGTGNEFRWMQYNLNNGTWEIISDWNQGNWTSWYPKKGNYWLHVEARNQQGGYAYETICFSVDRDYEKDFVRLQDMCWIINDRIDLGVYYDYDGEKPEFRWLVYDLNKKEWQEISGWTEGNWTSWYPKKGNYWVHVEMRNKKGKYDQKTICFTVDQDYEKDYVRLDGICWMANDKIDLGVYYKYDGDQPEFRWLVYDLEKKEWQEISGWYQDNWTSWRPKKGNYWVHVEARNQHGGYAEKTICFSVERDYK